ncbi:Receptor-type tyrosine-protein phosphatase delta [Geodia barretti]|uniref:Receptor-type tyrosine-protein phosphatase delta n=1 Tax=Geodia barretti TaxID=519541 RepID=A0AA35SAZ6_GEOBA|nr:Receptor-type tyrosine-protein phosphatase delta [Geodia barretti]
MTKLEELRSSGCHGECIDSTLMSSGSLSVAGFSPNTPYSCSLTANNSQGSGPPAVVTFTTEEDSPSGSPEMFRAVAGEREVEFSWSPPPPTQQNGVITSYTLSCSPSPSSLPQSPSSQSFGSLSVTGFSPNTLYSCSLTANNSKGSGPPAVVTVTTQQDSVTTVNSTTIVWKIRQRGGVPTKTNEKPYNRGGSSSNRAYEMKAPQQEYEPMESDTGKVPTTNKESHEGTLPETTTEDESYENGLNSVLVTWIPLGIYVTGYTIFYQRQGEQSVSAKGVGNTTEATIRSTVTLTYSISLPTGVTDTPSFEWEGPGEIPTPTDPTSSGRMVSSTLVLHEVATSQAGLYTCTASLRGTINTSTTLIVQISTPTPSISHSVLIAGTESNLSCDYSLGAYVDSHVAENVSWMVNGSAVATNGRRIILNNGQFLYFSPVSVSDSGRYTCQLFLYHRHHMCLYMGLYRVQMWPLPWKFHLPQMSWSQQLDSLLQARATPSNMPTQLRGFGPAEQQELLSPSIGVLQALVQAANTSAVITDLHPGAIYNCSIFTVGPLGNSEPKSQNITTLEAVPSGSPEMFGAVAGEREVEFSWSPPPPTQQNGVITSYTLSCSPSPSSLLQSQSSGSLSVTGFSPNTLYSCSLTANNSQGSGPPATYTFTTQQDSLYLYSPRFEMSLVPGSPGVIPTSTNSAYHTVKQEGRVTETYEIPLRAGDDGGYDIILCPSPPPPRPTSQQSLPKLPESEEVYEVIPGEDN